jgi:hypothetical protein
MLEKYTVGLVRTLFVHLLAVTIFVSIFASDAYAAPSVNSITDNRSTFTNSQVPKYEKFEINFQIGNVSASNLQFPFYQSTGSNDILNKYSQVGISVDGIFTDPDGLMFRQPGFYYQDFINDIKNGKPWYYPTDQYFWKVRFAPNKTGTWKFRLEAKDKGGTVQSPEQTFTVTNSANHGFLNVSKKDPRYFEFDNGTYFQGLGFNEAFNKAADESYLQILSSNGIKLLRMWMGPLNIYTTSWDGWYMMPGHYDNYLPRVPILPLTETSGAPGKFMWYLSQDSSWYEQCAFLGQTQDRTPIKPNTTYHIKAKYKGIDITGPRDPRFSNYGVVMKIGGWQTNCEDPYEPGVDPGYYETASVTTYGRDTNWNFIEGDWNSGTNTTLPNFYMALENAASGSKAYLESVEMRELSGGPNIIERHSPDALSYMGQLTSYKVDKMMDNLKKYDIYVRPVVLELNEYEFKKLDIYGNPLFTDSVDSFYGATNGCVNCRQLIASRWLQEAWWRYLQSRWGYSTQIHSWELINEGDPWHTGHYALTDEMGKYLKCRVFGIAVPYSDSTACTFDHPNAHMTSTSFWHSFPATQFWNNSKYPNVDFADIHAYISTGYAPLMEKTKMQYDAAYFHSWYSTDLGGWNLGKPIIRAETGMDCPSSQSETCLGIERDVNGVWLHNFLWAQVQPGAMLEGYWWVNKHIYNPQTSLNFLPLFKKYSDFSKNIPLNNGSYQNVAAVVGNTALRAWGQKDVVNDRAHLWIQNSQHTWKNVVDNVSISPISTSITISGFSPNKSLRVEWWDTYTGSPSQTTNLTTNNQGVLSLSITNLTTDTAVKIGDYTQSNITPTSTPNQLQGDINSDGIVNIQDYVLLSNAFGTNNTSADINKDGIVNLQDYVILSNNFGKTL